LLLLNIIKNNSSTLSSNSCIRVIYSRKSGRDYPIFYGEDHRVIRDVTFTVLALFPDGVSIDSSSHDRNWIYEIKRFLSYLMENDIPLARCNDKVLELYRGIMLVKAIKSKSGKANEYKAKRSVNVYLTYIYKFIAKYYELDRVARPFLIGCTDDHRIKSGMFNHEGTRLDSSNKDKELKFYPLLFKIANASSTLNPQDIPTDAEYFELLECIDETAKSSFVKNRDKLLVNIARHSAFRRISLNSLNASDFTDNVIHQAESDGTAPITPKKQKFGYGKSFDLDYSLLLQIQSYINHSLKPYLESKELLASWDGALFVNTTDGCRMTKRYMTQAISKYCRKLGWKKGKVIHALRHLFASSEFEDEYEKQLQIGDKDPSRAMRAAKVHLKNKLGHNSLASQEAYLVSARLRESKAFEQKKHEAEKVEVAYRAKQQREHQEVESKLELLKNNPHLDIDFF